MASFQKYGKGWRVFVKRKGVSKTGTFATKREAQDWALRMESLILSSTDEKRKRSFREMLLRYLDEVTVRKRDGRWERYFIARLLKHPIADVVGLDETDVAAYRDERLRSVQGVTVSREMTVMAHICNVAIREWKWMVSNPVSNVRKPPENRARDRRVTVAEIQLLEDAAQYSVPPQSIMQRTMHAFHFAVETAMRAGEIESLIWENVDLEKRTVFLPMTKNGMPRTVPLSGRAVDLLRQLPVSGASVFNLANLSASFIVLKKKAGIKDLHFHDTRHEAITRLAKKLDVLTLARMVGHRNVQQLMTYYNESAEDIAKKLG